MEKVLTIELEHDGSSLIELLDDLRFKSIAVGNIISTLETEIENIDLNDLSDGESITFKVTVQKKRTQKYMDELGEFDGF
jgi:hypothetical protein